MNVFIRLLPKSLQKRIFTHQCINKLKHLHIKALLHNAIGKKLLETYLPADSDAKRYYVCYQMCREISDNFDGFIGHQNWETFFPTHTIPTHTWRLIISREINSFIFSRSEDNLLRILSDLQDDCMTNLRYEYVYSNLNRELNLSTRLIKTILHNIYDEMSKQSTQYNKLLFTFQNA